ncbi:MAG: GntR family transcriptional regulator [Lactobacillus sp.]|jgi:GntR family transcriptional regulator of arabinose operon|nr:GntR family transcriptional regulator [Lactobacillus sp.]
MEKKYLTVKEKLKDSILSGTYKIHDKLPTETELIEKFNVSRYTVRRAVGELEDEHFIYRIQGGGMFVQDWHKNWTPAKERKIIGIITTHIADYIFPNIISGIDRVISEKGYSLLISNTHNNHEKERKSLISMLDSRVAGLIIEPTQSALENPNMDLYHEIEANEIPTIFINAVYPNLKFPAITTDDKVAEKKLIEFLFGLGHESILGIFQVDDIQGIHRMNGFVEAYQNRPEISFKSNLIIYQSGEPLANILAKMDLYLKLADRPTAIACYNDQLAIEVMDHLKSKQVRIPGDVSVVGFDDYQMSRFINPSLTTVSHQKEKMGEDAGKMVLALLDKEQVSSIEYEASLVKRHSAKPITKS